MTGGNRYNFLIVFFVALGSFTYGFNAAIIGSVYGLPSFLEYFHIELTGPNSSYGTQITGATNGLFAGGGMIGCMIVPWLADKFGRKVGIQMICVLCIVSAIIQGASVHIAMFLVGRFLNGVGVGMIDVIVPIYQLEVSPAKNRGRMVGSHGFLVVCGYVLNGHEDEGFGNLRKLHRRTNDPDEILAREEFLQIRQQVALDRLQKRSFIELWKKSSTRKRLLYGIFVQCIAQSTGVMVVNNYQVLLYKGLGLNGWLPLLLYALYDSWAAFMNWVNSMLLDRVGRIKIMTIGLVGCALSISCETAMVARYSGTSNVVGKGFGVFFLFLFVTFYGGSMDASSYVYCAEIFPTWMRAQGVGFSVMGLFARTLVYTQVAPVAFAQIGWRYYLVFIITPLCGVWIVAFAFPETKGLALEEIGALFGDEVAPNISHLSLEERETLDMSLTKLESSDRDKGQVEQSSWNQFVEKTLDIPTINAVPTLVNRKLLELHIL
ncbi:hypothetical protein V501_02371 [Pseudogymnoascus sp. VKM F-4519 (FW-2642)]|nr:hypothetical protein V501_02371 [Pseudogymnoascus sp. VKM F-4519 (FW-2642)]